MRHRGGSSSYTYHRNTYTSNYDKSYEDSSSDDMSDSMHGYHEDKKKRVPKSNTKTDKNRTVKSLPNFHRGKKHGTTKKKNLRKHYSDSSSSYSPRQSNDITDDSSNYSATRKLSDSSNSNHRTYYSSSDSSSDEDLPSYRSSRYSSESSESSDDSDSVDSSVTREEGKDKSDGYSNMLSALEIKKSRTPVGVWNIIYTHNNKRQTKAEFVLQILINGDKTFTTTVISQSRFNPLPYDINKGMGVWNMINENEIILDSYQYAYDQKSGDPNHYVKIRFTFKLNKTATRLKFSGEIKTYSTKGSSLMYTRSKVPKIKLSGHGIKVIEPSL